MQQRNMTDVEANEARVQRFMALLKEITRDLHSRLTYLARERGTALGVELFRRGIHPLPGECRDDIHTPRSCIACMLARALQAAIEQLAEGTLQRAAGEAAWEAMLTADAAAHAERLRQVHLDIIRDAIRVVLTSAGGES
jgi:hypothetical protein